MCQDTDHDYHEILCPQCGTVYCWNCAKGKGQSDYISKYSWANCPNCGHSHEYGKEED